MTGAPGVWLGLGVDATSEGRVLQRGSAGEARAAAVYRVRGGVRARPFGHADLLGSVQVAAGPLAQEAGVIRRLSRFATGRD
jgi:hypothetical protein